MCLCVCRWLKFNLFEHWGQTNRHLVGTFPPSWTISIYTNIQGRKHCPFAFFYFVSINWAFLLLYSYHFFFLYFYLFICHSFLARIVLMVCRLSWNIIAFMFIGWMYAHLWLYAYVRLVFFFIIYFSRFFIVDLSVFCCWYIPGTMFEQYGCWLCKK